ncbi:hypothetical protein BFU36_03275 [Sulfolobus sp. A20]|uniref:hypothetical protein n=1 Tax=Sulfolobaceae TaxID=118883 RepID=UPI000845FF0F|nr:MULTISPECIES: hypothetical protein [unclassified Sulfolobus]TRM78120.1 hypothetical protein DJ528_05460 [Sulfolobus sp. B5]TRM78569.1 hypothetical protein DJ532_00865 [Sulfolobus sp. A20-N-F8]TRM83169.1 hypothetical protein DJ531_06655 [Sulfolobus sp. A20-N-F6]TRN03941.1 hypothetical protein DJ527_01340 [Sulfolobus sp. F1]AOL15904.1 hypothetical protein BFU36_03275 [Sulfolobus sp. A20]
MRRNDIISYILLISINVASSQYFYLPVYFEYYLRSAEYSFIFSTASVSLRAAVSPFIAEVLKNRPKSSLFIAFAYQAILSWILFFKLLPLNIVVVALVGAINGLVTSLLLFLNAIFFSYSEPNLSSRYQRANFFISSKFLGYVVGSLITILILLFLLKGINDLFLASLIVWLICIPLIFALDTKKGKVSKPSILEVRKVFSAFSPFFLLSFMLSMSLATVGGLIEPLIFSKVSSAGWFSVSFILANVAGSIIPLYFPKSKISFNLVLGVTIATISEFLFPLTPQLYVLVAYGIFSQVGNSIVWPIMIGNMMSRSDYPVVESGVLATITDVSTLIADGFTALFYPILGAYSLSLFSIINLVVWVIFFLSRKKEM